MLPDAQVQFDEATIRLFKDKKEVWSLQWSGVERIGYRTTSGGPWYDYFLVFKTNTSPAMHYEIPMECRGAIALAEYVDQLTGTKLPREGKLASRLEDKSVTIWPAHKSGEPL